MTHVRRWRSRFLLLVGVVVVAGLILVSLAASSGEWGCPRSLGGELVGDDCHLGPMVPIDAKP
jgi:hypothetical protein